MDSLPSGVLTRTSHISLLEYHFTDEKSRFVYEKFLHVSKKCLTVWAGMKIKQKILVLGTGILVTALFSMVFISPSAFADPPATNVKCKDGKTVTAHKTDAAPGDILDDKDFQFACKKHGGYRVVDETIVCADDTMQSVYKSAADPKNKLTDADRKAACKGHKGIKKDTTTAPTPTTGATEPSCSAAILKGFCTKDGIWKILALVINILATGIGLVAVGGFIYAAILYATAEDNASQITKAKMTMTNIVIGLVAFALMYGFLQFLIPGGVFG